MRLFWQTEYVKNSTSGRKKSAKNGNFSFPLTKMTIRN